MITEWDLLNGRFVRRPLHHRLPPEPFASKQHERLDGLWAALASWHNATPMQQRVRQQRASEKRQDREFWWGYFARMRTPARKSMAQLNRVMGYQVPDHIPWRSLH